MKPASKNTALLLFVRTPHDEARHKFLLGKSRVKQQEQVYFKLNQHARQLGQKSGLPFFVIDSGEQQGHTFGERLHRALATVFARGFSNVIAIGNDCAQLRCQDITHAEILLQRNQAVFGPAQDGGVYLLGISQELFARPDAFLNINWQTSSVLRELQIWAQEVNYCTLPAIYADLDNSADLQQAAAARWLPTAITKYILCLFEPLTYTAIFIFSSVRYCFFRNIFFRGPPACE